MTRTSPRDMDSLRWSRSSRALAYYQLGGRGVSCAQDTRRHATVWKCPSTANLSLRSQGPLHSAYTPHLCKVRYEPSSLPCTPVPFVSTLADFTRATKTVLAFIMLLAPNYFGLLRLERTRALFRTTLVSRDSASSRTPRPGDAWRCDRSMGSKHRL